MIFCGHTASFKFWVEGKLLESRDGVVDKPPALYPAVPSSIPGFPSLSYDTISHGPISGLVLLVGPLVAPRHIVKKNIISPGSLVADAKERP